MQIAPGKAGSHTYTEDLGQHRAMVMQNSREATSHKILPSMGFTTTIQPRHQTPLYTRKESDRGNPQRTTPTDTESPTAQPLQKKHTGSATPIHH